MVFISVIIATFNRKEKLKEALNSVYVAAKKIERRVEIIIINDFGECVRDVILEFEKYENINLILLENLQNMGLSFSRNRGLGEAKGEFVAFLDDDDLFDEDHFYELQKTSQTNYADVYYSNTIIIKDRNSKKTCSDFSFKFSKEFLMVANYIPVISVFVRRNKIHNIFFSNKSASEDWDYWLKLLKEGLSFFHIDSNTALYYRNEEWLSMTNGITEKSVVDLFLENYKLIINDWPTTDEKISNYRKVVQEYYAQRTLYFENNGIVNLFSYERLIRELYEQFLNGIVQPTLNYGELFND